MAVGKSNQQISITLPKEYIEQLDKIAEYEFRTRSQLAAKIIMEYLSKCDMSKYE